MAARIIMYVILWVSGNSIQEISTEFEQSNKGYKDWVSDVQDV